MTLHILPAYLDESPTVDFFFSFPPRPAPAVTPPPKTTPRYGSVTDIVYSPDDGGWYAREMDLDAGRSRVTRRVYPTEAAARLASCSPRAWEVWS